MHLSSLPAIPITVAPLSFAICPTTLPVAPAAPDTTTNSPGLGSPMRRRPKYAVRPVNPSTERASMALRRGPSPVSGTGSVCLLALRTAYSVQPALLVRTSWPGLWDGDFEAMMRPTLLPRMVSSIWTGGM